MLTNEGGTKMKLNIGSLNKNDGAPGDDRDGIGRNPGEAWEEIGGGSSEIGTGSGDINS